MLLVGSRIIIFLSFKMISFISIKLMILIAYPSGSTVLECPSTPTLFKPFHVKNPDHEGYLSFSLCYLCSLYGFSAYLT